MESRGSQTVPVPGAPAGMRRLGAALAAGAIAIAVNTGLLVLADAIHFTTARGGLLRLVKIVLGGTAAALGLGGFWTHTVMPATAGQVFGSGFHIFVGLLMAIFYAYCVEPLLSGRALAKGLQYALAVWLVNALVVLPLIGQGVAGSKSLDASGMIGFAVIHTVFFVLLGLLYAHFRQEDRPAVVSC